MTKQSEMPRQPSRRSRAHTREIQRRTAVAFETREAGMQHYLACLNDPEPDPVEIEEARTRYLAACEAHVDQLLALCTSRSIR